MKKLLFLLLFVSFTAPTFAQESHPFGNEIQAFKEADAQNPPPKHAILFVGSSSIRKWTTLQEDYPNKQVINRGFGGSQFTGLLYYDDQIVYPYKPRQIFVYEGDNDLAAGVSCDSIFVRFKQFVAEVKDRLPGTEVNFIAIKPSPSRSNLLHKMRVANDLIHSYALLTDGVNYIDVYHPMLNEDGTVRQEIFSDDNLHMNATGYDLWQKIMRPYLD